MKVVKSLDEEKLFRTIYIRKHMRYFKEIANSFGEWEA